MKVTMAQNGVLTVTPETGAEAFALLKWTDEFRGRMDVSERSQSFWHADGLIIETTVKRDPA